MKKHLSFWLGLIVLLGALLRLPALDQYPPSLYSDEVSQGYNAYSILKTGHDEYGTFLPVSLRSFGDWKPPLQTYIMIPTIALFGLNEWGVRLPGALLGVATIPLVFVLSVQLINELAQGDMWMKKRVVEIGLIAAAWVAISPWHITQSRTAMLVQVSLFFLLLSIWFGLKGLKNPRFLYAAGVGFAITLYGYYGMRLVVPLVMLLCLVFFYDKLKQNIRTVIIVSVVFLIVLLPLLIGYFHEPNVLFGRVKTVSIFYDQGIPGRDSELMREDGIASSQFVSNYFHYTPYTYFLEIERRLFEHVGGEFLFITGDTHQPFTIPNMGILYGTDGVFLLIGTLLLVKREKRLAAVIFILSMIAILPAALTYVTPSQNRIFTLVYPLSLVAAVGVVGSADVVHQALRSVRNVNYMLPAVICVAYVLCGISFYKEYVNVLPKDHADWWHFGYKQLFSKLKTLEPKYSGVTISGQASVPYIFYLFYNQVDPRSISSQISRNYHADEYGFEHVNSFGGYQFPRRTTWDLDKTRLIANSLVALKENEEKIPNTQEIDKIVYPDGKTAFTIYALN